MTFLKVVDIAGSDNCIEDTIHNVIFSKIIKNTVNRVFTE